MSRMFIALACAVSLSSIGAMAQTAVTPEQHLEQARQLLAAVPPAQGAAGQALTTLQRDFADFATAYLARAASTSTPPAVSAPPAPASAPAGAAASGTTPPASAAQAAPDWRSRYLIVESDLTTLIGPRDAQGSAAVMPGLDPAGAQQLQQVRQQLETLYAATINARDGNPVAHTGPDTTGAPVPPTGAAPQTPPRDQGQQLAAAGQAAAPNGVSIDPGVAAALLDRMQTLVDNAIAGKPTTTPGPVGTTGSIEGAGKITVDRATLDELRSEIAQLRLMLNR